MMHSYLAKKCLDESRKNFRLAKNIWERFPVEVFKNSIIGSGYFFEDGIYYDMEVETKSDYDWFL